MYVRELEADRVAAATKKIENKNKEEEKENEISM
jgi:hypothetical protein